MPRAAEGTLRLADAGIKGATLRVSVNGRAVAAAEWPALTTLAEGERAPKRERVLAFSLPAGACEVVLENTGQADWVEFGSLDLGIDAPVLAAVGKRNARFAMAWVWDRENVFSQQPQPVHDALVVFDELEAGKWRVTWWDSVRGVRLPERVIEHGGGSLSLAVPPLSRHAAVMLERAE